MYIQLFYNFTMPYKLDANANSKYYFKEFILSSNWTKRDNANMEQAFMETLKPHF